MTVPLPNVDLDSADNCPVGERCTLCGSTDELAATTAETPVGIVCFTMCAGCFDVGTAPKVRSWSLAIELACAHCGHLGIDVDQMAALIDAEQGKTNLDPYAAGDGHPLFGGPL